MEYIGCRKVLVLPYNFNNVKDRKELLDFELNIDNNLKTKFQISEVKLLKKDEFLDNKRPFIDQTLNISQNSISDTLKNMNDKSRVCIILIPGEYHIRNENIKVETIKFYPIINDKEDKVKVNICGNFFIDCNYFDAKGVNFYISDEKDSYFSGNTYAGIIFTSKPSNISFNACKFKSLVEDVKIFDVIRGSTKVNIGNCLFVNSEFRIDDVNTCILNYNKFISSSPNLRFSNVMFYKNNFYGEFRLDSFNCHLLDFIKNTFESSYNPFYFINADHNTNLFFTSNLVKTDDNDFDEFSIFRVNRYSKCYINDTCFNLNPKQLFIKSEFGSASSLSNNKFNNLEIEVSGYDSELSYDKDNYDTNSNLVKFIISERGIIKPSKVVISI